MKIEQIRLKHDFLGHEFIDLRSLQISAEKKLFNHDVYQHLLKECLRKKYDTNLMPLTIFQEILKKYPKKKPCWCMSNLNFIDCHFYREKTDKLTQNQKNKELKTYLAYKQCLHEKVTPCSHEIIKAHSISRSSSLKSISKNNHVYGMKLDYKGMLFSKIGTKNASTFTGFCKKHDELLFASFEKNDFKKTSKQLFDLCYSAICIEYNTMQSVVNALTLSKKSIDNSENISKQISVQISTNSQIVFYNLGIKNSNYYKTKMEEFYKKKSYENLFKHYIFELSDGYPKFQSSSCFNLDIDFEGNFLQNLDNPHTQSKNLFVNCITLNGRGYFILSWFTENHSYGQQIIRSIINKPEKVEDKLFTLVFLYIHNTYASPDWFENLTPEQKSQLNSLQSFWNETDKFSIDMICSNFDSIKISAHYFYHY